MIVMSDPWDDALERAAEEPPEPRHPKRPVGRWAAVAAALIAAIAAGSIFFRGGPASPVEESPATAVATAPAAAPSRPLGEEAPAIDLPPLGESDPIVRQMVRQLSTHPQVAAWLATDGLIRNFTVVVDNVAEGKTPARQLRALRPPAPFTVIEGPDGTRIDPRSYERYDALADAAASIDPAGAARLYTMLKPRLDEAYAELGNADTTFDRALEQAIVQLLETPAPAGPLALKPQGASAYRYVDPLIETLSDAQKQLLRMGPRNAAIVQQKLRAIAEALNIPADRLPPPE
ncbi:MAG: DUF3014 domain-containing protein [Acidobacteria bacterium]|nr:DUF3014 domain-containing protein [Acidobacteriota bacterium]